MKVSALSGNEIFCLSLCGFSPGALVVGNSVQSLGLGGALGSSLRTLAGGEAESITSLISEGRHAAMKRLVDEAHRHGAHGVSGMTTELSTLAGYTEFLSQGTSLVSSTSHEFFTSSASGTELYCHRAAGYAPRSFVMGNVAYALGVGRGILGGLSTLALGEVHEFSEMYNRLRHLALFRLRREAVQHGANTVVDVRIQMRPFGVGIVEFLMTGTASHHPAFGPPATDPSRVVTSELTGTELFSLAQMGYAPVQLVMATSVYSLGFVSGIFASISSLARGELTQLTDLVYRARENCLGLLESEARSVGAEKVIGSRLQIRELMPGLIEVIAVGTAVKKLPGIEPNEGLTLPIQAVARDDDTLQVRTLASSLAGDSSEGSPFGRRAASQPGPTGCLVILLMLLGLGVSIAFAVYNAHPH